MKKCFLSLQEAFSRIRKGKLPLRLSFLDELSVPRIFFIWTFLIVIFGAGYHFLSGESGSLFSTVAKTNSNNLLEAIYFSFITATSTGFGDIVPHGFFGILAIVEVILGVLLLAFVTSKLVSIKQNMILGEIYEISFSEKVNRLRSSLLLFRQHLSRMSIKVESQEISKREINDLFIYINSLESVLEEMLPLIKQRDESGVAKVIDPMNTELLVNSINSSFKRLQELVGLLAENELEWQRPITISTIRRCISLNDKLFAVLMNSSKVKYGCINDLYSENQKRILEIEGFLPQDQD